MTSTYTAADIEILPGLEGIRRRPSMYIGSSGPQGVFQLVAELVQNSVDEALNGVCKAIRVTLDADGACTVADDGRGIPVAPLGNGRSALEVVLCELHAGGKFHAGAYEVAGGLHGVGLTCVNALSSQLTAVVCRDGHRYSIRCARGVVTHPIVDLGPDTSTGTTIRFEPDPLIFADGVRIDRPSLSRFLEEQAFLHPGLEVSLQADGATTNWRYDTGLDGFVRQLGRNRDPVHPDPLRLVGEADGISVEAVLWWTTDYGEDISSYVNSIRTPQGGAHLEGLKAALSRVLHHEARAQGMIEDDTLLGADVREGLVAVLSIRMRDPEFEGQTKAMLTTTRATAAVGASMSAALTASLHANPEAARAILGKAVEASRARLAARRASERARYRSLDTIVSKEVYRQQFGIRSKNWHDSAKWITDDALLEAHGGACVMGPEAEVLDVCCGSGVVGNSFRGRVKKVTGLDLTPQMVELSRQRLDEVVLGDVYDIPFPADRFDVVCNREVLHLLPAPEKPLSEVFRVLKPGGQFVVGQLVPYSAADAAWFFRVIKKKQPLLFNHLLAEDLEDLLRQAGFVNLTFTEVLQWEDIDTWINTWETPNLERHEIRDLYHRAPAEVRAVHPFSIGADGRIRDQWRWVIYSSFKPGLPAT